MKIAVKIGRKRYFIFFFVSKISKVNHNSVYSKSLHVVGSFERNRKQFIT